MTEISKYCENPEKCRLGIVLDHSINTLEKNNENISRKLEKLEENIIAIRDGLSAFRLLQDAITEVKHAVAKSDERMDKVPQIIDEKILRLNLDDRFKDIHEKLESKVSYRQIAFLIAIVSVIFTILNFVIGQIK